MNLVKEKLINVLLVEDNPSDELLFRNMLLECGGFTEDHFDKLAPAVARLREGGIDIVLLDISLPDSQGPETYRTVRSAFPDIPIILLAGLNDIDLGLTAIRDGVQDYLIKGHVNSMWLGRCIRYAIERKRWEIQLHKTEKALSASAKMAAIGQLTGGIAHDFNNMLTVIFGQSELMLSELSLSQEEMRERIQTIHEAGERAANLTRQLLAFTKKEEGHPTVTDINKVVLDLNKILKRSFGEDVAMTMSLDQQIAKIKIDITQLEQVIMNLCINARDAMPDGGKLGIATKVVDTPKGKKVVLSVEDSGQGMSEEVKNRIFEPFFTTKAPGKGTGLGLATVFSIVGQGGGHIDVQSEVSKGTRFDVYFPVTQEAPTAVHAAVLGKENLRGTERILIVEDEDEVRNLLRGSFERQGYKVTIAHDGAEGRKIALDPAFGGFDVIVSDVRMPICSGRDMVIGLRELIPNLKVVYMSGYSANAFGETGFHEDPITKFLQKPFSPRLLVSTVRKLIDSNLSL